MAVKKKNNTSFLKIRVLVAPLDWGLGHATRCIPIIHELLCQGCEVFIAAEKSIFALLREEFPRLAFLPLRGYRIKINHGRPFFSWKMVSQFPGIIYAIYYEKRWLKKIIRQHRVNLVISDNRVGLYNKKALCVYITHQLSIKTGNPVTSKIAGWIHGYFINKFTQCWVPDIEKEGLAGKLSHPASVHENVRYLGALSRFKKSGISQKRYDLLLILSGPEPQRSIFEKLLLSHLSNYEGKTLVVRGLPGSGNVVRPQKNVQMVDHLSSGELGEAIQQANCIISRSGYTTIMDLVKLGQSAILVPTPGQAEQEYLAGYLQEKGIFFSVEQENFRLTEALEGFSSSGCSVPEVQMDQYKQVIREFLGGFAPI